MVILWLYNYVYFDAGTVIFRNGCVCIILLLLLSSQHQIYSTEKEIVIFYICI